jgi:predicted RNA-binding protein associated with RNAse of E/G family
MLSAQQFDLVDKTWVETEVLMLVAPGAAHSVYAMWEQGHTSFRCWYINLQEPLRRTSMGFDTMDHLLDIVVSPDRSAWRWKDEDEFREAVALGVYSAEEARAIRAEGQRAIKRMQANQSPFCDGWEKWSPPAEWEIPGLPAGWDDIDDGNGLP